MAGLAFRLLLSPEARRNEEVLVLDVELGIASFRSPTIRVFSLPKETMRPSRGFFLLFSKKDKKNTGHHSSTAGTTAAPSDPSGEASPVDAGRGESATSTSTYS